MNKIIDVLKSDSGYMFTLPSDYGRYSHSHDYYKVDGKKVESGKTYTTDNIPVIEVWNTVSVQVKAKSKVESKPDLTIEEYERYKFDMEKKRVSDKYDEYLVFANLDDEYEYKKFLQDYEIIKRVDEELLNTAELNIVEKLESNNPYITLHRHLGGEITSKAATYNRWGFYKSYIRELLNKRGFEESDNNLGKPLLQYKIYEYNQGMVNLYIEGKQIFDIKVHNFSDDLDVVMKKYDEDKKWIEDKVNSYIRNTSTMPNVQDVISKLASFRRKVSEIDSKQKTYDTYRQALRWIDDYINELERTK